MTNLADSKARQFLFDHREEICKVCPSAADLVRSFSVEISATSSMRYFADSRVVNQQREAARAPPQLPVPVEGEGSLGKRDPGLLFVNPFPGETFQLIPSFLMMSEHYLCRADKGE